MAAWFMLRSRTGFGILGRHRVSSLGSKSVFLMVKVDTEQAAAEVEAEAMSTEQMLKTVFFSFCQCLLLDTILNWTLVFV